MKNRDIQVSYTVARCSGMPAKGGDPFDWSWAAGVDRGRCALLTLTGWLMLAAGRN
jgi:hypothetical protein